MKTNILLGLLLLTSIAKADSLITCEITQIKGSHSGRFNSYLPPKVGDQFTFSSSAATIEHSITFKSSNMIPLLAPLVKQKTYPHDLAYESNFENGYIVTTLHLSFRNPQLKIRGAIRQQVKESAENVVTVATLSCQN